MKKKSQNGILYIGIILLLLGWGSTVISSSEIESANSRYDAMIAFNIPLLVLLIVIVAPVLEELIFRGLLVSSKPVRIISVILFIPTVSYLLFANFGVLFMIVFLSVMVCLGALLKLRIIGRTVAIMVFSSLVFGLVHYNAEGFRVLSDILPVISHISIGLILSWIAYNYGLGRAIGSHMGYNFIVLLLFFFPVFFTDSKIYKVQTDHHELSWSQLPFSLNYEGSTLQETEFLTIEGLTLKNILSFTLYKKTFSDVLPHPFTRYNMHFRSTDGTPLTQAEIRELLIQAEILKDTVPTRGVKGSVKIPR